MYTGCQAKSELHQLLPKLVGSLGSVAVVPAGGVVVLAGVADVAVVVVEAVKTSSAASAAAGALHFSSLESSSSFSFVQAS